MIVSFQTLRIASSNDSLGWMTAEIFLKLSVKLAAEQGIIDGSEEELQTKYSSFHNSLSTQCVIRKACSPRRVRKALGMVTNQSSAAIRNENHASNTT